MRWNRIAQAAAVLLALAGQGHAQGLEGGELAPGNQMSRTDLKLMEAIGPRLYRKDDAVTGTFETWQNPKNGHSGTIRVLDVFARDGVPCRKVEYVTVFGAASRTDDVLTWCRISSGDWKIQ